VQRFLHLLARLSPQPHRAARIRPCGRSEAAGRIGWHPNVFEGREGLARGAPPLEKAWCFEGASMAEKPTTLASQSRHQGCPTGLVWPNPGVPSQDARVAADST
jgi:hypothetical protein